MLGKCSNRAIAPIHDLLLLTCWLSLAGLYEMCVWMGCLHPKMSEAVPDAKALLDLAYILSLFVHTFILYTKGSRR